MSFNNEYESSYQRQAKWQSKGSVVVSFGLMQIPITFIVKPKEIRDNFKRQQSQEKSQEKSLF